MRLYTQIQIAIKRFTEHLQNTMSVTMSADAHTQMMNEINALGREVRELKKENKELQKENMELSKKSNAKSDIIRNMFDFITEDPEEVQEGFTINREWGHKYIDGWNDIVSEEMKAVVKDINKELDGDEMEWRTDGYEFSLHIKDESESEDEEV